MNGGRTASATRGTRHMDTLINNVARVLASPMPRRALLQMLAAGVAAGVFSRNVYAQFNDGNPCQQGSGRSTGCRCTLGGPANQCVTGTSCQACFDGGLPACTPAGGSCCHAADNANGQPGGAVVCTGAAGTCCASASQCCGTAGRSCCNGVCCSSGASCCGGVTCCASGATCCGSQCCNSNQCCRDGATCEASTGASGAPC